MPAGRSSIHFGAFQPLQELKSYEKRLGSSSSGVTCVLFWYHFRKRLHLWAALSCSTCFLCAFLTSDTDDGYLFYGSLLSFVSCFLVVMSYYHIIPWRRHPSSLMLQVSITSLIVSLLLLCTSHPLGPDFRHFHSSGLYNDGVDNRAHSGPCQTMSFLAQLVLLARELWVFSLSLDLVTSITNPFASYQTNLRRYHLIIWSVATASAATLLLHPQCQGRFLSDGTCWIREGGSTPDQLCFWGYFLGWVAVFYLFSVATILYAYVRISKGLESSYATRYACVAATFRVVLFYFVYCAVFYALFAAIYTRSPSTSHSRTALGLERAYVCLISVRGFLDALVWFYSHGLEDGGGNSQSVVAISVSQQRPRISTSMSSLLWGGLQQTTHFYNMLNVTERESHAESVTSMLGSDVDDQCSVNHSAIHSSHSRHGSAARSAYVNNSSVDQLQHVGLDGSSQRPDNDLSPQLNFALRAELLYLVTLGVKESVMRLDQREVAILMSSGDHSCQSPSSNRSVRSTAIGGVSCCDWLTSMCCSCFVFSRSDSLSDDELTHAASRDSSRAGGLSTNSARGLLKSSSIQVSLSTAGSHIQYAVQSLLCGLRGVHIPGEYGVDPVSYSLLPMDAAALSPTVQLQVADGGDHHQQRHHPPSIAGSATNRTELFMSHSDSHSDSNGNPLPSALLASLLHDDPESHQRPLPQHQQQTPQVAYAPAEVIFDLNAKHQFRDFRAASFRKLRQLAGLTEEKYLTLIAQPTKEKLSEGASGAFFFYCGEGELVVKTVAQHEATCLLSILDQYLDYLTKRPESLLVRFLGLHSICMYGNEFAFVVMKNVFPSGERLSDMYDIKGSWVNRHAPRVRPGKRTTCKYCNEEFVEGTPSQCSEVVGSHEAVVTLRDNDMVSKIRLAPQHAYELIDILNSDSDALCSMGMMDYSLLVGVKTRQYDLDGEHMSVSDSAKGHYSRAGAPHNATGKVKVLQTPPTITEKEEEEDPSTAAPLPGVSEDVGYPARAVVAPCKYYVGVIDILQTWSWKKRLERFFKVNVLRQSAEGVSCIDPVAYKLRYQRKVSQIIEHSIFVREVTGSWKGKR